MSLSPWLIFLRKGLVIYSSRGCRKLGLSNSREF
nr:MAG TPA: hypothetical protein [Caudoviricetes sp.]